MRQENYGAITSWHVHYKNSYEVEFGMTLPRWAEIPIESGTQKVVMDGCVILYDPQQRLSDLMAILSKGKIFQE